MTKKILQDEIIERGGAILSEGTLKTEDLLAAVYDAITFYDLNKELAKAIEDVFEGELPTQFNLFYGLAKLNEDRREEADYLLNEDVFNFFNEIAPEGFYFGCTEGDGACIGFFKWAEEE